MAEGGQIIQDVQVPSWWRQILASQRRETKRVIAELMAMRGLMPLLMKARNGGYWTAEEKVELLLHLRRIAHVSPYLLFLLLPGSAVFLPLYAWWLDRRRNERPGARDANVKPGCSTSRPPADSA